MSAIGFIIKASEGQPEVIVVDEDCECTQYTAPIEILSDSETETDAEDACGSVELPQAETQAPEAPQKEKQEEIADNLKTPAETQAPEAPQKEKQEEIVEDFKTPAKFSEIIEEKPKEEEEIFVPRRSERFKPSGMRQPVFGKNPVSNKRSRSDSGSN